MVKYKIGYARAMKRTARKEVTYFRTGNISPDIFQNRELKHLETEKGVREPHEEHTKAGISEPTAQLGRNQDANEGIE